MDLVVERRRKRGKRKAPVNKERKKQGHLVLTPNILVPC